MQKISTGDDSTLGNWRKLVASAFGEGPALRFLDMEIAKAPHKENEEVLTSEEQFLFLLASRQYGRMP